MIIRSGRPRTPPATAHNNQQKYPDCDQLEECADGHDQDAQSWVSTVGLEAAEEETERHQHQGSDQAPRNETQGTGRRVSEQTERAGKGDLNQ